MSISPINDTAYFTAVAQLLATAAPEADTTLCGWYDMFQESLTALLEAAGRLDPAENAERRQQALRPPPPEKRKKASGGKKCFLPGRDAYDDRPQQHYVECTPRGGPCGEKTSFIFSRIVTEGRSIK